MDLTEEDQAAVEGGLQAEALLGMEFFTKLVEDLTLAAALDLLGTKPEASVERERIYHKSQGLQAVLEELHGRVAAKESVMFRLEQEAALKAPEDE